MKKIKKPTPKELGGMLFSIHQHHPQTEEIIYFEKDIIHLLKILGHPKVEWGENINIEDFKQSKM